jgi:hypothetical protein
MGRTPSAILARRARPRATGPPAPARQPQPAWPSPPAPARQPRPPDPGPHGQPRAGDRRNESRRWDGGKPAEAGCTRPFSAIRQPPERASLARESAKADFAQWLPRVHSPGGGESRPPLSFRGSRFAVARAARKAGRRGRNLAGAAAGSGRATEHVPRMVVPSFRARVSGQGGVRRGAALRMTTWGDRCILHSSLFSSVLFLRASAPLRETCFRGARGCGCNRYRAAHPPRSANAAAGRFFIHP